MAKVTFEKIDNGYKNPASYIASNGMTIEDGGYGYKYDVYENEPCAKLLAHFELLKEAKAYCAEYQPEETFAHCTIVQEAWDCFKVYDENEEMVLTVNYLEDARKMCRRIESRLEEAETDDDEEAEDAAETTNDNEETTYTIKVNNAELNKILAGLERSRDEYLGRAREAETEAENTRYINIGAKYGILASNIREWIKDEPTNYPHLEIVEDHRNYEVHDKYGIRYTTKYLSSAHRYCKALEAELVKTPNADDILQYIHCNFKRIGKLDDSVHLRTFADLYHIRKAVDALAK